MWRQAGGCSKSYSSVCVGGGGCQAPSDLKPHLPLEPLTIRPCIRTQGGGTNTELPPPWLAFSLGQTGMTKIRQQARMGERPAPHAGQMLDYGSTTAAPPLPLPHPLPQVFGSCCGFAWDTAIWKPVVTGKKCQGRGKVCPSPLLNSSLYCPSMSPCRKDPSVAMGLTHK
jgi:hypothetical protein